jgi:hypothetical protein
LLFLQFLRVDFLGLLRLLEVGLAVHFVFVHGRGVGSSPPAPKPLAATDRRLSPPSR